MSFLQWFFTKERYALSSYSWQGFFLLIRECFGQM